jgi:hypothetical protein
MRHLIVVLKHNPKCGNLEDILRLSIPFSAGGHGGNETQPRQKRRDLLGFTKKEFILLFSNGWKRNES